MHICLFFFFQAEDGIRDLTVTGVQTCALPIFSTRSRLHLRNHRYVCVCVNKRDQTYTQRADGHSSMNRPPTCNWKCLRRSEERRVGKECRTRRSPEYEKKKQKMNSRKYRRESE